MMLEAEAGKLRMPGYGYDSGDALLIDWELADAYLHLGQTALAIRQLRGALRLRDGWNYFVVAYPALNFRLGQLYARTGDRTRAAEHFGRFLEVFTQPDPEYRPWVDEARALVAQPGS